MFASLNKYKTEKMKKLIGIALGVLVTASTVLATNSKGEKAAFEIDTKASKVYWTGKKITGEHTGYLSIGSGTVNVENKAVVSANINMDLNSIVCTDLEDETYNKKLVGHLKSEDFFSVEKYPNAIFNITSVKKNSSVEHQVVGNLTIKGITHEITFPAKIGVENENVTAKGRTAKIDRTKWNIQYGSGKFFEGLGDKMIYDEFEIRFDISAKTAYTNLSVK